MSTEILTEDVTLSFVCSEEESHPSGLEVFVSQPLEDLPITGTPVCPECDGDMTLESTAIYAPTTLSTPVSGDLCSLSSSIAPGAVTHYRCDEYADGTVTTPHGIYREAAPSALKGFDRTPRALSSRSNPLLADFREHMTGIFRGMLDTPLERESQEADIWLLLLTDDAAQRALYGFGTDHTTAHLQHARHVLRRISSMGASYRK